jgi:glucose-6-phosphate isomerase
MCHHQGICEDTGVIFDPGLAIEVEISPLGFKYGKAVFGPKPEYRQLDQIRPSLHRPDCDGPDPVYAIIMDVGKRRDAGELQRRMLLFGVVTYAAGQLGNEPVRSQGHRHKVSLHSGWRPPELYEIWSGRAIIYMQERVEKNPGRCFAIEAGPGETVLVPPSWAHATISADPAEPRTFGACCDREYGFEYDALRAQQGLAWYPILSPDHRIGWVANPRYGECLLVERKARTYEEIGLNPARPLYRQFEENPAKLQWVSKPALLEKYWLEFEP